MACRGEGGFTLSELVVVLALIGVLFTSFSLLLSGTVRHGGEIQEQNLTQTELRSAVDQLASELRQAYSGDAATPLVEVANGTEIQFLSPDNSSPFRLRRISYRLTGAALERAMATSTDNDGPPWSFPALGTYRTLVDSIQNTTPFSYLDIGNVATTTASEVRTIDMTFTVATRSAQDRQYTYGTSASLRATP